MKARRFGIAIIGLALLAAVARLGWRAGLGRDAHRATSRSLPVEDYAPAPPPVVPPAAAERSLPAPAVKAEPSSPAAPPSQAPPPPESPAAKDAVTRARVRSEIQKAFETKLPRYKLSPEQFEQLADDVMTIRRARERMNSLPLTAENAAEHERLREELGKAVADWEDVARISLQDFTEAVQPQEGITKEGDEANGSVVQESPPPNPPAPTTGPPAPSPGAGR